MNTKRTASELIRPAAMSRLSLAARIAEHFEAYPAVPYTVEPRECPALQIYTRELNDTFPNISLPMWCAFRDALRFIAALSEPLAHGPVVLSSAPKSRIPWFFVYKVLATLINDAHVPQFHHSAQTRGYCPRGRFYIETYKGRFGAGYIVHFPSEKHAPGRHCIDYYINTKETQS